MTIVSQIHPAGIEAAAPYADIETLPDAAPETLRRALSDAHAVVLRSFGRIDADAMDAAPNLRVIARHGVGVDNVDLEAAAERGIWAVYTPEANAEAVAEHVIGSALAFQRRLVAADRAAREGDWSMRDRDYGFELLGRTIGVVGAGRIGARVAEIAARGFRMKTLYCDIAPRPDLERELGAERTELDELLERSDIVTAHAPATAETIGMFRRERFQKMKRTALFINAARGALHREPDLIEALKAGEIAGACLDVFETEPLPTDSPLTRLPNVLLSPHKAGQSERSMRSMSLVTVDALRVLRGEEPRFPANRPMHPREPVG